MPRSMRYENICRYPRNEGNLILFAVTSTCRYSGGRFACRTAPQKRGPGRCCVAVDLPFLLAGVHRARRAYSAEGRWWSRSEEEKSSSPWRRFSGMMRRCRNGGDRAMPRLARARGFWQAGRRKRAAEAGTPRAARRRSAAVCGVDQLWPPAGDRQDAEPPTAALLTRRMTGCLACRNARARKGSLNDWDYRQRKAMCAASSSNMPSLLLDGA